MTRAITVSERRTRLAWRHRLAAAARSGSPADIARSLVVLHASDPATVVLSILARMADPQPSEVERALYEERTLVRMLGMRRTLFVVPTEAIATVQSASTNAVAATERTRLLALLRDKGVTTDAPRWLRRVERKTLAAVTEAGEALATELTPVVPELAIQIPVNEGKRYAGTIGVSSRVLFLLAAEGHLVRARPRGTWISGQHRWTPTDRWLGSPIDDMEVGEARRCLATAWLERFGPATVADLRWWTGWTLGVTRATLAELDLEEVDLDGTAGLLLAGDVDPRDLSVAAAEQEPWVALLPSLDPTAMGWKERDWYVGSHQAQVFDRNGNAGATVWADGRMVGGWAQRRTGEIVFRLLEDIGAQRSAMVAEEANRLGLALGDIRITPRFPAPLDKALAA